MARPWPLLLALFLCVSIPPGRAAAVENAPSDKDQEAKPKITFPPHLETKFVKFLGKLKEAKRKELKESMQKEVESITKATGLNPAEAKALETPAQQVIDLCLEDWIGRTDQMFRRDLRQPASVLSQILDQMLAQPEAYAAQDTVEGYVRPAEHPVWVEALQRSLTPEQAAAWKKIQTERLEAFQKEMGDFLKGITENAREQYAKSILGTAVGVKRSLGLSKERAEQIDQLAKSAADHSAAEWRKRAEQMLLQWDEAPRRALLKNRQFFMGMELDELPDRQSMWKEGLARILSADEIKRLKTEEEERRLRRVRATGVLMVAEFDEKAAFTTIQRERLEPIATRMVSEESSLFSDDSTPYSVGFSWQAFLAVGARAKGQEMKEILDPIQWRHWQEVCNQNSPDADSETEGDPEEQSAGAGAKPRGIVEPEEREAAISDFLCEKTEKEKNRMLPPMVLKAEDAGRVAGLNADAIGRLETAARGASDKLLDGWKSSADQWVRSLLQDATEENVRQRLRNLQTYNLPRDNNLAPDKDLIWTGAVKTELTAAQTVEWTKEVDERSAYKNKAVALAAMAEFDRRIPLATAQWEKLEPLIVSIVNDYAAEISTMYGYNRNTRWYMQAYSIFLPFAGVPEKDFKDILGKEQWERWAGDPEFTNSRMNWTNIQQNHASRLKRVK